MKEIDSPAAVGEYMGGVPVATLAQWRYEKRGPAFIKVGRLVKYRKADVDAYLAANTVRTADAA